MLGALTLARQILALAPDAAALLKGLVNLVREHDVKTQRIALDAAFTAAEDALAAKLRGRA
jgi:hypothetical protein